MDEFKYVPNEIKKILSEVTICQKLYITKNGNIYSKSAEQFLDWINQYTKYCIPEEIENWKKITRETIYSPLVLEPNVKCTPEIQQLIEEREYEIIADLFNFMDAGAIMEKYAKTKSWDEVKDLISLQGHSGYTFAGMCNVIFQFSPYVVEFVDIFCPNIIEYNKDFKKKYVYAKKCKNNNI